MNTKCEFEHEDNGPHEGCSEFAAPTYHRCRAEGQVHLIFDPQLAAYPFGDDPITDPGLGWWKANYCPEHWAYVKTDPFCTPAY